MMYFSLGRMLGQEHGRQSQGKQHQPEFRLAFDFDEIRPGHPGLAKDNLK